MADKKISALTGATTPLAGTEVLPIVQSGATVKVSVANLTAGRAVATAGGSFTDNITQSTAAKGVDFSANTPAAGATSTLLNWYEEGTWTPTVRGSGTAGTYEIGTNGCTYTRIGRQVTLNVFIQIQSPVTGGGTGDLQITGVPFAKAANANPTAAVYLATGTYAGDPPIATWQSFSSSSTILLTQIASGGFGSAIPISFASAGAYIAFTMTYFV